MTSYATVSLWGRDIGAIALDGESGYATFAFDPEFRSSGIEIAPLTMPLADQKYQFPELPQQTFFGLPGLLADSLPDRFGNSLIDAWLESNGRERGSLNAVERLTYTGARGMGALEYVPAIGPRPDTRNEIDVATMVKLATEISTARNDLATSFATSTRKAALADILRVGTSAGGARPKAVIAWNPATNQVRSGQIDAGDGFEHWILKFDGVGGHRDRDFEQPLGYGLIEYAYHRMANDAGILMSDCRLLQEGGRSHFMTRRFDRQPDGGKIHMQSLGAIAHYDYNQPGAHSYEQALFVVRKLDLGMDAVEQQFRRMAFNIIARNQDDHVKNIAFTMDKQGIWALSPAFDLTYAWDPANFWMKSHQMSLNGKLDGFALEDFKSCARHASMKRGRAEAIIEEVRTVVSRWRDYADDVGVDPDQRDRIQRALRLEPFK